ncbi:hypothetical protein BFJ69_g15512 [Fusarium oxysporum]|uniref:Uncharacterized protein n=1 Tax=Fusarium oxysporum TaxID=5507 RepID=A0A420ME16_FUSOX|nr:hypothetical protein BFJ69_g15512 [Fusarium oxysporum]
MLTIAVDSELLERYVVRGDAVQISELESKVKGVKGTVEAAFVGLLEVKYNNERKLEEVVFPHGSAKEFLLDTVEGWNLWQPYDISREEVWTRHFKSLMADGRFYSEDPDSSLSHGVVIRDLLIDTFKWEEEKAISPDIIISFLEIARVCFFRGHLHHYHENNLLK